MFRITPCKVLWMRLYQLDVQTSGTYNWETYNWDCTVLPWPYLHQKCKEDMRSVEPDGCMRSDRWPGCPYRRCSTPPAGAPWWSESLACQWLSCLERAAQRCSGAVQLRFSGRAHWGRGSRRVDGVVQSGDIGAPSLNERLRPGRVPGKRQSVACTDRVRSAPRAASCCLLSLLLRRQLTLANSVRTLRKPLKSRMGVVC